MVSVKKKEIRLKRMIAALFFVMLLIVTVQWSVTVNAKQESAAAKTGAQSGSRAAGQGWTFDETEYKLTIATDAGMTAWKETINIEKRGEIHKAEIQESVTEIPDSMFYGLSNLTEVTLPNSLTKIGNYAFQNCKGLRSIQLPDSVTSIGNSAFRNCELLTEIELPEKLESLGSNAFNGCSELAKVTLNSTTPPMLGSNAFYNCAFVKNVKQGIHIPDGCAWDYLKAESWESFVQYITADDVVSSGVWGSAENVSEAGYLLDADGTLAIIKRTGAWQEGREADATLAEKVKRAVFLYPANSLKELSMEDFGDCKNLIEVEIPDGVETLYARTFSGCSSLKSITLSSRLKNIYAYAFEDCNSLTRDRKSVV